MTNDDESSIDWGAVVDWGAVAIAAGTFFDFLPAVASLMSVIWFALRIYETDTVQRLLGKPC